MKNLVLIFLLTLFSCTKEQFKPRCESVTFLYKDTREIIISWPHVCDLELEYYRAMSKYDTLCNGRIQELIIGDDHCFKKY